MRGLPAPPPRDRAWSLLLDFDGTLVDIAARPDDAHVDAALRAGLARLHREAEGALAIVTGRGLGDLDRHLQPLVLPAAGQHGLERRRADGTLVRADADQGRLDVARAAFRRLAAEDGRLLVEDKGLTLALHFRLAPDRGDEIAALAADLHGGFGPALDLLAGKGAVEFRPPTAHKGHAIAAFQAEPPFAGRRPVFLGDDVTDEDGFRTVAGLGGIGVRIGPPPASIAASAAGYALPDVAAARVWLGIG